MTREEIMNLSKQELFSENTITTVFEEESQFTQQILLNALVDRAKDFKESRQMQSLIKAFKKEVQETMTRNRDMCRMTEFYHPTLPEMACGGWIANEEGVWIPVLMGSRTACYHPIMPTCRLRNLETKTEKIVLEYKRDGYWQHMSFDKSVVISASKILKLGDYGIMVNSETAKALVQYLSDVEALNDIPLEHSTSKLGWHSKDFIPYDKTIVFDEESKFNDLFKSLTQCGSYDIWLDLVKKVRQNKKHYEPRVYMAAAFASILVSQLNMLPFIVNVYGKTGGGKTVSMMLAASIWADPAENRYITDSYSTQNAFEIRLDILNHLPLMIDDFSKIRDRMGDNFTDLIYLICSGKGKDRSNVDLGLNKVKTWSNITLSNMERPLANDTMKGGAINRILDFQMEEGDIFENGNIVVETIKDNFGFAGPLFVEYVKEIGIEKVKNLRREFEQKIKEEARNQMTEKEEKQILPLSLILAVDKLVTDYFFQDGIYLDLPFMVNQLKNISDISEGMRAYRIVMDYFEIYSSKFSQKSEFKPESWGYESEGYINIVPTILNNISEKHNFSTKILCDWCKFHDLLKTNNNKNQNVVKIDGVTKRFYTFKIGYDEEEAENRMNTGDDGFIDADRNELPFD